MKVTAAQIDITSTITLARSPHADSAADPWGSVSTDVVQRFLDAYWVKHGVSRETLEAYRVDLDVLDGWLKRARGRSLVTARPGDIRDFLTTRSQRGGITGAELPSLSCIKRFYSYLLAGGYRGDDPTDSVFVRTPRLVRRDLAVIS
ncbi:MAG TPA: site-specific integrase [Steroidobacteraceae bacterium]